MTIARSLASCSLIVLSAGMVLAQPVSLLAPVNAFVSGSSGGANMCQACMAIADFNGDGKPDIAYAGNELLPFSGVVLGNGDGTFRPAVTFPLDNEGPPNSIHAADFNGDGKPDVVYSSDGLVWIALGNGDGTFQAQITVSACSSVASVADFNGDGKADLVCGTTVLPSNGDGTFRAAVTVDPNQMDGAVLTADFNNDGKPDLLLLRVSGEFAVVLGNGDGTFGADLPVGGDLFIEPLPGDFNGDGRIDLVGLCERGGVLCVLPGNGDGTFGSAILTPGIGGFPYIPSSTGDFNGDRKLDLVAGNAVLTGNGDGTFQIPIFFGPVTQACGAAASTLIPNLVPCAYGTIAGAVADFNGDGLPDIAAGSVEADLSEKSNVLIAVLLNDRPGDGFLTPGVSSADLSWPVAPGSIVSAFGVNLAPSTQSAASVYSLPTTLGGIRVHVRDNSTGDRLAQLLYVSPTQINYVMPSSDPYPWVGIEIVGTPYVPKGIAVPVQAVAPGFYSVGARLAAASALSVTPYAQTFVPVLSCGGSTCTSVPIDLSGPPVYLSLYGTGFDRAVAASSNCSIAGQTLPVSYAGPQEQIVGLDQVNVLLPESLAGTGLTSVTCQFLSTPTNAVSVNIR